VVRVPGKVVPLRHGVLSTRGEDILSSPPKDWYVGRTGHRTYSYTPLVSDWAGTGLPTGLSHCHTDLDVVDSVGRYGR
jgi:hypothetical protein